MPDDQRQGRKLGSIQINKLNNQRFRSAPRRRWDLSGNYKVYRWPDENFEDRTINHQPKLVITCYYRLDERSIKPPLIDRSTL